MASYIQGQRLMTVQTPLGPDVLLLTGFSGTEELSSLYSFKLDLIADNKRKEEVAFDKLLGREITVGVDVLGAKPRHISGICIDIQQGDQDETFTTYQIEIVPKLWLLTKRTQSRIFQHLDVPQILKKVFHGIEYEQSFARVHEVREYCVQYRESDFDFASRLMEEEGIFYYFKHTEGGHKLVLTDKPGYPSVPGPVSIPYAVNEGNRPMLRIHKWSKRQRLRSGKVALWDSSFHLPGKNLEAKRATIPDVSVGSVKHQLNVANSDLELYDYPGEYAKRFDGVSRHGADQPDRLAKIHEDNVRAARIRMEAEAAQALVIEGVSNCTHFVTGHKFKLERHFDASGDYVIKSITHKATGGVAFRAGQTDEFSYQNTFTCLPAQVEFRSERKTSKPIVHGVQTAFVVGPADEEIYIDKHARVKVHFQWDRESKRNENSSCWVRVSQAWAGGSFGGVSHPRIGQEVIVEFEEGDPDRPIVTGRVYNAANMPHNSNAGRDGKKGNKQPKDARDSKMMTSFKSNSTPGGGGHNEITMNDTKGGEGLFMKAQKDEIHNVGNDREDSVGNNESRKVGVDRTRTVGNNETVKIGNNETVAIGTNATETVGSAKVIDVGTTLLIRAGVSITLQCGASTIHMNQAGFITISGTVITSVAAVNNSVIAPLTEIVGAVMLAETGAVVKIFGGATHVGSASLTAITGPKVTSVASGENIVQGATVKIN